MAIGIAKMIGFKFPENFNNPYISSSITEFWRRWHISLGTWMRNYFYIPLGGNRVETKRRLYFNLWVVILASGLWHGASWCFVIWGAYHGMFLVMERAFLLKIYKKIGKIPSILITFLIVVIGWVFFRIDQVDNALLFIKKMFTFKGLSIYTFDSEFYFYFIIAVLFAFCGMLKIGEKIQNNFYFNDFNNKKHIIIFTIVIILFMLSIASITSFGFNPFIYFRF
jgi:alginate O-acetyltransferase complex protein AlgI